MAVVATVIEMTNSYRPYERPPQPLTLWSAIPRGLQSFLVPTEALDAKPVNDTQTLDLTATLPPNFGYVLMDYSFSITQDVAFNWTNVQHLNLQNYYIAPLNLSVALSNTWTNDFVSQGPGPTVRNSQFSSAGERAIPSFPMYAPQGTSGVLVRISAHNDNVAVGAAGTVNAYISFWQFDLEQIRKFPINSPNPTHSR